MQEAPREAWMRGSLPGLDPVISHLVRASQQIREDITAALTGLSPAALRSTSAGFHAKHLAGSTRRLCAYLAGRALTDDELAAIANESTGDEPADELIGLVNAAFDIYDALIQSLRPEEYGSLRYIGRARLPVTAISIAIHIVEHGQRHVGQAISAVKLAHA